ncbi:hypothetical protein [Candidatus Methylobacter favarea]|nr:hypothetical protein [Candidatus Methylobacter favarea]
MVELAPEVKPLFKEDMKIRGNKMMSMLNTVDRSLNNIEAIMPIVEESGRRHESCLS